jgi:DNA/RNA endonuclease G (NUC1)
VQTHEVIGSPPNVSVPTHFAKIVLASRLSSPSAPDVFELSTGAFVLPNAIIPDEAPLESFVMPGEHFYLSKHQVVHEISPQWKRLNEPRVLPFLLTL